MSSHDKVGTWVRRGSLAAGIAYTATAEYELAHTLGAAWPVAVMLPVAIDCYLIAALRWFRAFDIALSLALMGAAQVSAHALEAGVLSVSLDLVTVVSLLVPVAIWRTHALARQTPRDAHQDAQDTEDATPSAAVLSVPDSTMVELPEPVEPPTVTLERDDQQDADRTPELPPGTDQDTEDAEDGPPPEPPLMTSAQVAFYYNVEPSTIRNWVAAGRLTVHSKDARGRNLFHAAQLPDKYLAVRA